MYRFLHDEDQQPFCWNPDEDLLTLLTESVRGWSNRDKTLWVCNPSLEKDEQQAMGIRVDVRIRSHVRDIRGLQVESGRRTMDGSSQPFTGPGLLMGPGTDSKRSNP